MNERDLIQQVIDTLDGISGCEIPERNCVFYPDELTDKLRAMLAAPEPEVVAHVWQSISDPNWKTVRLAGSEPIRGSRCISELIRKDS